MSLLQHDKYEKDSIISFFHYMTTEGFGEVMFLGLQSNKQVRHSYFSYVLLKHLSISFPRGLVNFFGDFLYTFEKNG